MIMNLGSPEIYEAIHQWIKNQGISTKGKTVTIEVKSGRKGNGPSGVVKIEAAPVEGHQTPSEAPFEGSLGAIADLGDLS